MLIDRYFYDLLNFDSNLGGGIFLKALKILNLDYELILISIFYISVLVIDYIFKENRCRNYILFAILILCFPMPIIYQKYLDPLFFIIFFGLIKSETIDSMVKVKGYNLMLIYTYFGSFLLLSTLFYKLSN